MLQKYLKTPALFTALSVLASGLNFLYYPVIAHYLSLAQFGDVQVGIAFVMQAAALFSSLSILALFFTAQKASNPDLTVRLERVIIAVSLSLAVLVVAFAAPLASILQLRDPQILFMLAVIFMVNIPCATWLGSLQGNGQFLASGIISVISSATKLVLGVAAIALGAGTYGALFGLFAGSLIILPLAYFAQNTKTVSFRRTFARLKVSDIEFLNGHREIVMIFGCIFLLAITSTLDILFSKMYLEPSDAGQYAQFSTVAKIPYFAAVPLTIILFEKFIKDLKPHVAESLTFVALVSSAALVTIFGRNIILDLFFGSATNSIIIVPLCLGFSLYVLTTLVVYKTLAQRRTRVAAVISGCSLLLPVILFISNTHNESSIALSFLFSQAATLLIAVTLQYTKRHA